MTSECVYTVDTVKDRIVTLLDDDGHAIAVDRFLLPRGLVNGVAVRVPLDAVGWPRWPESRLDSAETNRRRRRSQEIFAQLERISGPTALV